MPYITKSFVKSAKCKEGKQKEEFYDSELKGFLLEVRNNGRKTFYLRLSNPIAKKTTYTKLGDTTTLDADTARTKAIKLKRSIEEGIESISQTNESSPSNQPSITLNEFYENFYEPFVKKHIKSHAANISLFKNHILPSIGGKPMSEIKKMEIIKLHSDMIYKKRLAPATANKTLIFISHAYHLAKEFGLPHIDSNPAKGVKPFEENNEQQRFLTKPETKRLLYAVNKSENPHLKFIIPMLILTGARRGEVLKARWIDFDTTNNLWTIPTTKNGKKRILPITPQLQSLLSSIPNTSPYLFPSPKTNKPMLSIYSSWHNARTRAGLGDVRLHDLRHSFASSLVNSGRSLYEVQTLLGHSTSKMTQRYAHLSNEALMKAASCAGRLIG